MKRWMTGLVLAMSLGHTWAMNVGPNTYGQSLLAPALATDKAVRSLALHAIVPGSDSGTVVAASDVSLVGKPSARVTGPKLAVDAQAKFEMAAGAGIVTLPLEDVSGDPVGLLEVGFGPGSGLGQQALLQHAQQIQAWLHRRISHVANLLDPVPYEPDARLHTRAQQLADQVLAQHPDIEIFAIHATPPEGDYNVIVASNIGRIGKKGDNDDMRCVYTGKPNLEVNATGKRFEVEMQLHDSQGKVIGAVSVVYGYRPGADKEALHKSAEAVRAALERQIPSSDSLFEPAARAAPLAMAGHTELPGYTGDFDHFEADVPRDRLLLAAEDQGTLEVFNLHTGKHLRTVKGFDAPHSPFLVPGTQRLLLTDGSGSIKVLDAESLATTGEIKTHPGADSIGYDAASGRLFVVTGGKDVKLQESWLEEFDPKTGTKYSEVHFDANHVEAVAVEQGGRHVYVNITDKNQLAVVNRASHSIEAVWPIREAGQNAMVQLDPASHELFVISRKPGKLMVLDAATGATRATFAAPARIDQEILDVGNRRVYAPGGDGHVGVYAIGAGGQVEALAPVPSAPGAKTGILVPELQRLYLAASPGESKSGAALIWFDVQPGG
jgi:hypothetical protein